MRARSATLFLLACLALPRARAWAQAASECTVHITPPSGSTIPASVPALHYVVVTRGANPPAAASQAPQGVQLTSRAGVALPVMVRDDLSYGYRIQLMEKPVPSTSYKLRYPDPCAGPAAFGEADITFGRDAPLPSKVPEIALQPMTGDVRYGCRGDTYVLKAHPFLDVQMSLDGEWRDFLPVLMVESLVDGTVWGRGAYGDVQNVKVPTSGAGIHRAADTLYPACGGRGEGGAQNECSIASLGLTEGRHQLEVKLRILGGERDTPPVAQSFEISCAGYTPGAGGVVPPPGSGGGGSTKSGGCSFGDGAVGSDAPVLLALLILLARRRRR